MIYTYTQYNMLALMQKVGSLQREQILRFFSDEMSESRLQYLLDKFVINNYLKYDPVKERYRYHASPDIEPITEQKRINAFWVLANWGSNQIIQVDLMEYPLQYSVISIENICYDITVCYSEAEAQMARRYWDLHSAKDIPDDVNHIAVVPWKDLGDKLGKYGFDSYCVINPSSYTVNYTILE